MGFVVEFDLKSCHVMCVVLLWVQAKWFSLLTLIAMLVAALSWVFAGKHLGGVASADEYVRVFLLSSFHLSHVSQPCSLLQLVSPRSVNCFIMLQCGS